MMLDNFTSTQAWKNKVYHSLGLANSCYFSLGFPVWQKTLKISRFEKGRNILQEK